MSDIEGQIVFSGLFWKYLHKSNKDRVALEIGCVPGRFLAYVCKHFGYFPEGIDFVKDADQITGKILRNSGIKEYKIYTQDFLEWKAEKKYDLVLSMGFIEHFQNPYEISKKHVDILKKGGKLILEVPNFANGQKLLHYHLDRENLSRHNTASMSKSYFKTFAKRFNLRIDYLGYYGGLFKFFWINKHPTRMQNRAYMVLNAISNFTKKINLANRYFSPYLIMIAQKM